MKRFLSEAAEKIINNEHISEQSIVVLPNRRSELFLKEEIKKISSNNIWLPEFYPVNEFIQKASGIKKADNISIYFELYKIHEKIGGNEKKTLDEFLTWAPIMLSDFNDIDNSLADADDIFKQLSAIKAIQQWNPDGRPLTQLQENYIQFYNTLFDYYSELRTTMDSMGVGYQGFISRYLAENSSTLLINRNWNNIILVGINALSEAEIKIFDYINQNYKTDFIWDVDEYYFSKNTGSNNHKEAGENIRNIIKRLKINEPENIGNNLSSTAKMINILGVPKRVGQTKFVGQELQELFEANINNKDNYPPMVDTAIVLADEGLLIPLLNSLPSLKKDNNETLSYNVTLGYPLSNTQVDHFFNTWIDLMISRSQNNGRIHTSDLISLLNNSILKQLRTDIGLSSDALIKYIINNNISAITLEELQTRYSTNEKSLFQVLSKLINNKGEANIISILEDLRDFLYSLINNINIYNVLTQEQVKQLIKIISKLLWIIPQNNKIINFKAVKQIVRQLINQSNINLIGEPLRGVQIMGMLETRTLDFKNIYILSSNEGIIPKATNIASFIPMDIRKQHLLLLPSDNADIYAYHFYRLIQRAENINLIYNSNPDRLGGGEKSRFILQIENELSKVNPHIKLKNRIINTDLSQLESRNKASEIIEIEKNEQIQLRLSEIVINGFSPSLISSYISCPLKFYFSQILRIDTTTGLEKSVEANTFGTVIHAVLEEMYMPLEGKEIKPDIIKSYITKTHQLLFNQFKNHYSQSNLSTGKNLLTFEVAASYINKFLKWDIKNIKQHPVVLQNTEYKYFANIKHNSLNIKFKGIIDRIDRRISDGTIQIIDYKTGRVLQKDLVVKDTEELLTSPAYAKAFQVIYYAWLYNQKEHIEKLEAGIISLRSLSEGFISLKIQGINRIQDYFSEFTNSLLKLVGKILDPQSPFTQTPDSSQCSWCDYKSICNR